MLGALSAPKSPTAEDSRGGRRPGEGRETGQALPARLPMRGGRMATCARDLGARRAIRRLTHPAARRGEGPAIVSTCRRSRPPCSSFGVVQAVTARFAQAE
jgi:hypothetical protein